MSEESTTPDLVELTRHAITSAVHGDFDAAMSVYGPRSVVDTSGMGIEMTYEGVAAIRELFEDWGGAYEEQEIEIEEILDLGGSVTIAVNVQKGRLAGSSSHIEMRYASVCEWAQGLIVRVTHYLDIDEARAAAERLAEERGQAMSQENVEVVRRYYAHRQATGDILAEAIAPNYVWDMSHFRGWPEQQTYEGIDGARRFVREWTAAFDDWAIEVVDIHDAGDDRVVAVIDQRGRSRSTGLPVEMRFAQVFTMRDGKQVRMEMYDDPDEALKAVGLAE